MALIEYNDPILLMQAIERVQTPDHFLADTFFPQKTPILNSGNQIMIEMRKGKRRLAPFVVPGTKGVNMERDTSFFETYNVPMVAPRRNISPEDIRHRAFGETIYSQTTGAQRAAELINRDLTEMKNYIEYRKEQMAAEILTTGKYQIKSYADDGKAYILEEVDFGWNQKITPAVHWDNPSATIYEDLYNASRLIQKNSEKLPTVMLCGENIEGYLMKNTRIKEILMVPNRDNLAMANIAPKFEGANGIRRIGYFPSLNLEAYTYLATYDDGVNTNIPYIGADDCIVIAPGQGRQIHGSVDVVNDAGNGYDTIAAEYVPKFSGDYDAQQVSLTVYSRFLLAPSPWADEWACIKTMG